MWKQCDKNYVGCYKTFPDTMNSIYKVISHLEMVHMAVFWVVQWSPVVQGEVHLEDLVP